MVDRNSWALWKKKCRCCVRVRDSWRQCESVAASSNWECPLGQRPITASGWVRFPRSRRSAKLDLEDYTACFCQKKLWVNIAVSLFLPPVVCLTHHKALPPRKIKNNADFFSRCGPSSWHMMRTYQLVSWLSPQVGNMLNLYCWQWVFMGYHLYKS